MSTENRDPSDINYIVAGTGPLVRLIQKMFDRAKSALPDQAPAFECFVLLRGMGSAIHGSLSISEDGLLRMLSPLPPSVSGPKRGEVEMVEQFFYADDVESIAVKKQVTRPFNSPFGLIK